MSDRLVEKTILLNQDHINKAIKMFNAITEKDAVNRALEIVTEEADIINIHKEIGGVGGAKDVFK